MKMIAITLSVVIWVLSIPPLVADDYYSVVEFSKVKEGMVDKFIESSLEVYVPGVELETIDYKPSTERLTLRAASKELQVMSQWSDAVALVGKNTLQAKPIKKRLVTSNNKIIDNCWKKHGNGAVVRKKLKRCVDTAAAITGGLLTVGDAVLFKEWLRSKKLGSKSDFRKFLNETKG